ncbi:MAG: DUF6602 domain-containing protein [Hyphomicrobium sp.]
MSKKRKSSLAEFEKTNEWLRRVTDAALRQRSAHTSFHGIEEELRDLQQAVLASYRKSRSLNHPREMGDEREEILRHFLTTSGLLPACFAVAKTSTHVVAPSGHISPELDILIFDAQRAIVLKRFKKVEFYPIESVHGAIQVKSKLTRKSLADGLDNIARFKGLKPEVPLSQDMGGLTMEAGLYRRFGVLFAYEYDLDWTDVISTLETHLAKRGADLFPNLIVILDRGLICLGTDEKFLWRQRDLVKVVEPIIRGCPNQPHDTLLSFYTILIDLLKTSTAGTPELATYLRMPLTAGSLSYRFSYGAFSEVEKCPEHGDYLRRFSEVSLRKVIDECSRSEPINWVKAMDLAVGRPGDNSEAYRNQPAEVRIYNPDALPLHTILANGKGSLTFDSVESGDLVCLVPWVYVLHEGLIDPCPKCKPKVRRKKISSSSVISRQRGRK